MLVAHTIPRTTTIFRTLVPRTHMISIGRKCIDLKSISAEDKILIQDVLKQMRKPKKVSEKTLRKTLRKTSRKTSRKKNK